MTAVEKRRGEGEIAEHLKADEVRRVGRERERERVERVPMKSTMKEILWSFPPQVSLLKTFFPGEVKKQL